MNQKRLQFIAIGIVVFLFLLINSIYVINPSTTAIRLRLGKVEQNNIEQGLHFKLPFFDNIKKYDQRLQILETKPEPFLTLEKKNLIVDTFVQWKVSDPKVFYERVQGSPTRLNNLLRPVIQDSYRAQFAKRNLQEVVAGIDENSGETMRTSIQAEILNNVKATGIGYGIDVVDVRIKGVELPDDVKESVFERMNTERERAAKEFRARGDATYVEKIANVDKERQIQLANAYSKAEILRGEGDAEAARIYAQAFSANPEFYKFSKSLNVYKNSLRKDGDLLILDTDSEFFQYFQPK